MRRACKQSGSSLLDRGLKIFQIQFRLLRLVLVPRPKRCRISRDALRRVFQEPTEHQNEIIGIGEVQ